MADKHYIEQIRHTEDYLLPYFQKHIPDFAGISILEAGCAEAGFLRILHEKGIRIRGLELMENRIRIALNKNPSLNVMQGDMTDPALPEKISERFDLIVLRDVIEHIPDRDSVFKNLTQLLKSGGYVYFSFPPRYSPFAGHHQNGRSLLKFFPWLTLLPKPVVRWVGKHLREKPHIIENAYHNVRNGLSIRRFETVCKMYNFEFVLKELFLFRPIYKIRFNLQPKRTLNVPVLRELFSTGCECLLQWKGALNE